MHSPCPAQKIFLSSFVTLPFPSPFLVSYLHIYVYSPLCGLPLVHYMKKMEEPTPFMVMVCASGPAVRISARTLDSF